MVAPSPRAETQGRDPVDPISHNLCVSSSGACRGDGWSFYEFLSARGRDVAGCFSCAVAAIADSGTAVVLARKEPDGSSAGERRPSTCRRRRGGSGERQRACGRGVECSKSRYQAAPWRSLRRSFATPYPGYTPRSGRPAPRDGRSSPWPRLSRVHTGLHASRHCRTPFRSTRPR